MQTYKQTSGRHVRYNCVCCYAFGRGRVDILEGWATFFSDTRTRKIVYTHTRTRARILLQLLGTVYRVSCTGAARDVVIKLSGRV